VIEPEFCATPTKVSIFSVTFPESCPDASCPAKVKWTLLKPERSASKDTLPSPSTTPAVFTVGEVVPYSGVYRITHYPPHTGEEALTLTKGSTFPQCVHCSHVSYMLIRLEFCLGAENSGLSVRPTFREDFLLEHSRFGKQADSVDSFQSADVPADS